MFFNINNIFKNQKLCVLYWMKFWKKIINMFENLELNLQLASCANESKCLMDYWKWIGKVFNKRKFEHFWKFILPFALFFNNTTHSNSKVSSHKSSWKKWGLIYLHQDIVILLYCCFKRKTEKKKNMIVLYCETFSW